MRGSMLVCALLLCACGQKEPPVVMSEYFPLVDGAMYEYRHSKGNWVEQLTVEALGGASFVLRQSPDPDGETSRSELRIVGGDVLRVAEEVSKNGALSYRAEYDPGFLRFSADWLEADEGDEFTKRYQRTETHAGEDPKDPEPRGHTFTIESLSEDVTVPAGTFRDCLRVRRERVVDETHAAILDAGDGDAGDGDAGIGDGAGSGQDAKEQLFWFARGVGKVREENVLTGSYEVLSSYEVPGE